MFLPNAKCRIQLSTGETNLYGQPKPGRWITEPCTVVKLILKTEHTSVRADTSASRGNAEELLADAKVLLAAHSQAKIGDVIELEGALLRITGMEYRRDAMGRLDHLEAISTIWRKK
jgi:uncharacterized Zn finger protein